MSFEEKSNLSMVLILVLVYGAYFAVVGRWMVTTPVEEIPYQPILVIMVIPLVVLAVIGHILLAVFKPDEAGVTDERDRAITLRGEEVGGYVLAVGVFAGLVAAMVELPYFVVAHTLLLGWVLAEILAGVTKTVLYRRGA